MTVQKKNIVLILMILLFTPVLFSQPSTPVLQLVTVNHSDASATLWWTTTPSPGLAGYVIYRYQNNEGYAIDTIRDLSVLTYNDYNTPALFYSETYVVAALDFDDNVSPLSNPVSTMFLVAHIDTCNLKIDLLWNIINPPVAQVTAYEILASTGGEFTSIGTTAPDKTTFTINDFDFYSSYLYQIKAILNNGDSSLSNRAVVLTNLPRPPEWIETPHITINPAGLIELNILYDPFSELSEFRIERKSADDSEFRTIYSLNSSGGSITYNDLNADPEKRHVYRVSAINSCNTPAIVSESSVNIAAKAEIANSILNVSWNSYIGWAEGVDHYTLNITSADNIIEAITIPGSDTIFATSYSDLMYDLTGGDVCFSVIAERYLVPQINSQSKSNISCLETLENIIVPNAFTPDGNGVNDYWVPVLSYTPKSYYLAVRSRVGRTIFESNSFQQPWDGTHKGEKQPADVYLWYLKVVTPSGKVVEKSGTLLLIYNQQGPV